ncbi:MAG TPA: hypothetical protein VGF69_03355 [Thermoanaerobaculia bacterium]|jgi:hypothetical protein
MMKAAVFGLAVVISVFALTPTAQASCLGCYCDHISNGTFTTNASWAFTNWVGNSAQNASWTQISDCTPVQNDGVADLTKAGSEIEHILYVPSNGGFAYMVDFTVYAPNYASATSWDSVSVYISDDLGRSEYAGTAYLNSMTNCFKNFSFPLQYDYSNRTVIVEIRKSRYSSMTTYLDYASFIGQTC